MSETRSTSVLLNRAAAWSPSGVSASRVPGNGVVCSASIRRSQVTMAMAIQRTRPAFAAGSLRARRLASGVRPAFGRSCRGACGKKKYTSSRITFRLTRVSRSRIFLRTIPRFICISPRRTPHGSTKSSFGLPRLNETLLPAAYLLPFGTSKENSCATSVTATRIQKT
jgi:hypothetical protein